MKMKNKITIFTMSNVPNLFPGEGATARLIIPVNCTGKKISIRFSNLLGKKEGRIDHVMIAKCDKNGGLEYDTAKDITVHGQAEIVIPRGEISVSDEIDFAVAPGEYLAVSIFCREEAQSVGRLGAFIRRKEGGEDQCRTDFTCIEKGKTEIFLEQTQGLEMMPMVPYFRGIDVVTEDTPAVIGCMGDSLTEHCKWFRPVLEELYQRYPGKVCLLNHGIGGNRLLPGGEQFAWSDSCGAAAVDRVDWDAAADFGITHILFALGVNDLGMGKIDSSGQFLPTEEEYREGCRRFVEKAHEKGIQVIAFTVFPAKSNQEHLIKAEEMRQKWNTLIRTGGIFDDVIDVENILKDPAQTGYKAEYVQSDEVHINEKGGKALAGIITEKIGEIL